MLGKEDLEEYLRIMCKEINIKHTSKDDVHISRLWQLMHFAI